MQYFERSALGGCFLLGTFLWLFACAYSFVVHVVLFEFHIVGYGILAVTLPSMVSARTSQAEQGRMQVRRHLFAQPNNLVDRTINYL